MNTPAPQNTCRQCGGPMASNAPEGLCARCLLSVAMKEPEPSERSDPSDPSDPAPFPKPLPSPAPSDIPDIADSAEVAHRLPQFEILELLGRGGMGVVYKARQLNLDRIVALKILPPADALTPDFVERFRREARSLAKLSHANIVAVYDFGEAGGLYYFVMEFVDGVNLRAMIRAGKMKPEEALAVVPKICDALQFAHEEGVVHRDIKPENILIDKRGRVKIADFGLAKLLRREQTDNTLTMSGMTLGTPRYMAPEQMDKPETVDHRADIYSLGVVFYEMLTGEVPMGRFAPPSERVQIDVRLDEIVLHALERDADRRYQHASQVRDDVEKVTSKPQAPVPYDAATSGAGIQSHAENVSGMAGPEAPDARPKSPAIHPLPRFFWLRIFALLLLGWAAVFALWNYRATGFVLGAVVLAGISQELWLAHARRNPGWREKWRSASAWKRFNILCWIIPVTVIFLMLIGGMLLEWDSFMLRSNNFAPSRQQFEAQYKGKEYQLIRRLDAFKAQVPAVELSSEGFSGFSMERETGSTIAWILIIPSSVVLVLLFQQATGEEAFSAWKVRRGGWKPAFACAIPVLGSAFVAYWALMLLWIFHGVLGAFGGTVLSKRTATTVNNTIVVQATVKQAADALYNWTSENGYTGAGNRWAIQTVPKGEQIGEAEVFSLWKASSFERWQMTSSGPERPFPNLAVQIIGSEKPAQSEVMIFSGSTFDGMVGTGSEKQKRWEAIVKNLSDTVARAANPEAPSLAQAAAVNAKDSSSQWLAIAGILAATLLWIFMRARSLKFGEEGPEKPHSLPSQPGNNPSSDVEIKASPAPAEIPAPRSSS